MPYMVLWEISTVNQKSKSTDWGLSQKCEQGCNHKLQTGWRALNPFSRILVVLVKKCRRLRLRYIFLARLRPTAPIRRWGKRQYTHGNHEWSQPLYEELMSLIAAQELHLQRPFPPPSIQTITLCWENYLNNLPDTCPTKARRPLLVARSVVYNFFLPGGRVSVDFGKSA